ncbi:MAG: Pr6Pr family membrane protein [Coriobacteriales bacterium]|nr:Pr6Pr family membrane protein [Coriobacteriales bacterium]
MIIKNRILNIIFKTIIFLISGLGVACSLGFLKPALSLDSLCFFTVLSGVLIAIYFLIDVIYLIKNANQAGEPNEFSPTFKHIALLASLLTGIIANTLLVGVNVPTELPDIVSMHCLHEITPILVLVDFIFFEKHGNIKVRDPFIWLVFPIAYLIFAELGAGPLALDLNPMDITTCYPYPFLDPTLAGVQTVAIYVFAMRVGYIAIGFAHFGIDKEIAKIKKLRFKAKVFLKNYKNLTKIDTDVVFYTKTLLC